MGSDQHHKGELEPGSLIRADVYIRNRLSQTLIMGELRSAIAEGLIASDAEFAELGAIVAGTSNDRTSATEITIADLTVQDTAITTHARTPAASAGLGTNIEG